MIATPRPGRRPGNPNFSSACCAKHPGFRIEALAGARLGRSHRAKDAKERIDEIITRSRTLLGIPPEWRVGIVPGSDTGAIEMALWGLLEHRRGVDVLSFESFGAHWATDVVRQLRIVNHRVLEAPYGELPDLATVDFSHDVVLAWNGSASGVRIPDGDWIPADRTGLVITDATSAVFAMPLPWDKLDVVTWSWQKALGGEAAHGMIALAPRAIARLETHEAPWPIPKIFRLMKGSQLNEGIFQGETINTPSMLAVEDALDGLRWAESVGGLAELIARTERNFRTIVEWARRSSWAEFLATRPEWRSPTTICLRITSPSYKALATPAQADLVKRLTEMLETDGIAYDIGSYREAPPGLRIWGGPTIQTSDIAALLPWLDWAFAKATLAASRVETVA